MLPELFFAVLFAASPGAAAADPAAALPTLLVSRVEGRVTAGEGDGTVVEVRHRQVLPGEWSLAFPPRSRLAGVCSNDRRLRIGPPTSRAIVGEACSDGRTVARGTYRALAHGRLELATERVRETSVRLLSAPIRGSDEADPLVPTLLDPRESAVLEARPQIRWTRVHGAVEYELELSGTTPWRRVLETEDVPCAVEDYPPGRMEVCAVPWPEDEPGLHPGEPVYLKVGARTGRVTPLRAGDAWAVRRVPEATADAVAEGLDVLVEAGLEAPDRAIRAALLLAGEGLIGEACRSLRESLAEHPTPEGFLLLGGLDLDRELPRAAARSFRKAIELATDPPTPEGAVITRHAREGLTAAHGFLSRALRTIRP